tara:strand:- start:6266 stop:6667 length:402 start_codon:yes stop_codon:yes gene_type:complete
MPGTPEEYKASPDYSKAASMIDDLIASGEASGDSILSALSDSGLRVYAEGAMDGPEEEMPGEMSEGEMGMDPEMSTEGMPMEEPPGEGPGEGPSMIGGPEQGGRGMLIEAVRFGLAKDKEKKNSRKKQEEEYE